MKLRRIVYTLVILLALTVAVSAESYYFFAPIQGEYIEVIGAFINPATGDYFPPDDLGQVPTDLFICLILDTGASGNLISAMTQGFIDDPLLGDWPGVSLPIKSHNTIEIGGIGDDVGYASVSEPVNVQVNGNYFLQQAIEADPENIDVDFTGFPIEYNCQMIVATLDGTPYVSVDLVGMPFLQDKWTVIYPQQRVTGAWNTWLPFDQNTADVRFYDRGSPEVPDCAEWIELWYPEGQLHNLDNPGEDPSVSTSPNIDGVRLSYEGLETTARMIVDTGAPLTFISSEVALAMGLDPESTNPDDLRQIGGVTGTVVEVPGFFIDYLTLETIDGDELIYVSMMVYVLDILDSEGEIYTDGLIGNNLFHYERDPEGAYVGYDTVFFDMEEGLLGLNHPDFVDAPFMPEVLLTLQEQYESGAVPLPPTWMLLSLGLGGFLLRRRFL